MDNIFLHQFDFLNKKRVSGFKVFCSIDNNQITSLYILDFIEQRKHLSEFISIRDFLQLIYGFVINDIIYKYKKGTFNINISFTELIDLLQDLKQEHLEKNINYYKNLIDLSDYEYSQYILTEIRVFKSLLGLGLFGILFSDLDHDIGDNEIAHIYSHFLDHLILKTLNVYYYYYYINFDGKLIFLPFDKERTTKYINYAFNVFDPTIEITYNEKLHQILKLNDKLIGDKIVVNYYSQEFLDYYKLICIKIQRIIYEKDILNLPYFMEFINQKELKLNYNCDNQSLINIKKFWMEYCRTFLYPLYNDHIFSH